MFQHQAAVGVADGRHNNGTARRCGDAAQGRTYLHAVPYALRRGRTGGRLRGAEPLPAVDTDVDRAVRNLLPVRTRGRVQNVAVGRASSWCACAADNAAHHLLQPHHLLPRSRTPHPTTGIFSTCTTNMVVRRHLLNSCCYDM